jgi:phage repressor protein C with HTH and peptisase S24 domain
MDPNRIREWRERRRLSQPKLAASAGTSPAQISKLEKGDRKLTQRWMERLARPLGCNPADLLPVAGYHEDADGTRHLVATVLNSPGSITFAGEDYVAVPVYDIRVSAGPGSLVEDGEPAAELNLYRHSWLQRWARQDTKHLAILTVAGDSMWETLHDGDQVLLDRSITRIGRDGIYVLRLDTELVVKRVSLHPSTKLLTVKPDNPRYETYAGIKPDDVTVIGRVVWLGRNVG